MFRSGLPQPLSSQMPFDLIKAVATQTETSLLISIKQYAAGERVDLLDDHDFPARTITETFHKARKIQV